MAEWLAKQLRVIALSIKSPIRSGKRVGKPTNLLEDDVWVALYPLATDEAKADPDPGCPYMEISADWSSDIRTNRNRGASWIS